MQILRRVHTAFEIEDRARGPAQKHRICGIRGAAIGHWTVPERKIGLFAHAQMLAFLLPAPQLEQQTSRAGQIAHGDVELQGLVDVQLDRTRVVANLRGLAVVRNFLVESVARTGVALVVDVQLAHGTQLTQSEMQGHMQLEILEVFLPNQLRAERTKVQPADLQLELGREVAGVLQGETVPDALAVGLLRTHTATVNEHIGAAIQQLGQLLGRQLQHALLLAVERLQTPVKAVVYLQQPDGILR
mmetsp:Transcript_57121/g.100312  ORF Transcript_57121/g.100312 Transcript_57121/m.100312 type:complete len:245 (-) Transcript_57121:1185-1919(-)